MADTLRLKNDDMYEFRLSVLLSYDDAIVQKNLSVQTAMLMNLICLLKDLRISKPLFIGLLFWNVYLIWRCKTSLHF